jgi:cell division septation protein DedD
VKQEQLPPNLAEDELFTLDISSALFPTSQNNAFSPSDYKNLQQTSLALLTKFQSAYQDRTRQYIDVQSTLEVEREEADEAETRVRSLRSQLEDLASQVSSRDTIISDLVTQLAEEKRARAEEKEARERSIQLVRERASQSSKHSSTSSLGLNIEDLGIRNGGKGHSKYGHHNSIDLSSPADSETESLSTSSIFSRSRSPTLTISSANASTDSTPEIAQAAFARVVANPGHIKSTSTSSSSSTSTPRPQRPKPQQQKSTFARLLTLSSPSSSANETEIAEEEGCANCRGQDSSVAWDTVGLLRAENRGLKERVGELEASVEGALDLCSGLGFGGR